ncbi:Lipoprotein (plasmid) [Caballeronia sp. S22]
MILRVCHFFNIPRRQLSRCSADALRAAMVLLIVVSLVGCAPSSDPGRRAVEQDSQAYRCAGFNPIADETSYPSDVELASRTLQHSPACSEAARRLTSGEKP